MRRVSSSSRFFAAFCSVTSVLTLFSTAFSTVLSKALSSVSTVCSTVSSGLALAEDASMLSIRSSWRSIREVRLFLPSTVLRSRCNDLSSESTFESKSPVSGVFATVDEGKTGVPTLLKLGPLGALSSSSTRGGSLSSSSTRTASLSTLRADFSSSLRRTGSMDKSASVSVVRRAATLSDKAFDSPNVLDDVVLVIRKVLLER